jgi:hypothetical protein
MPCGNRAASGMGEPQASGRDFGQAVKTERPLDQPFNLLLRLDRHGQHDDMFGQRQLPPADLFRPFLKESHVVLHVSATMNPKRAALEVVATQFGSLTME